MESVADVLGRYNPGQPDAVQAIKDYIDKQFHLPAGVMIQGERVIITVSSSAFANSLRFRVRDIQKIAGGKKSITFRIG